MIRHAFKIRVGFEPGGDGAGVSDSLRHGRVAVGVSVADEVDASELTSSIGPTDLNLEGIRSGVIIFSAALASLRLSSQR